jgi:uncharacterized protein (TIGR03083 family)
MDTRALITEQRADLVALLNALPPDRWRVKTAVPGWTVKDIALHLIDDDLGVLSRSRDGEDSGQLEWIDHRQFVQSLAAKNQRWIDGAQALSREVVIGLLRWTGVQLDEYYQTVKLDGDGHVSWASDESVPMWLDIAREFTERWVHEMQIREGLDEVGDQVQKYLPTVLRTFVWALPHQYRVAAAEGNAVQIDLDSGGTWQLTCRGSRRWSLSERPCSEPSATAYFADDAGWRWLTGGPVSLNAIALDGPAHLTDPLLQIRAIIA